MKTDLTHLPPDQQVGHVVAYIMNRVATGGGRAQEIYASDLAEKFKHRGAGYGSQRLHYFSGLLKIANKVIAAATGQAPAEPASAEDLPPTAEGTPPAKIVILDCDATK